MSAADFLTPDFLKVFVPLAGAVVAWLMNERRRWVAEQHARKEERYASFLTGIRGFYVDPDDGSLVEDDAREVHQLRRKFIDELNKSWLYCQTR